MRETPPAWLDEIITEAIGSGITDWRQPGEGAVAATHVVNVAGREHPLVYKGGGTSIWTGDVIEPLVVDYVGSRTDLPVPAVVASGTDGPQGRWAIYDYLPGQPMRGIRGEYRRRLIRAAGAVLGRLHSQLSQNRLGRLGRRDDKLVVVPGGILETPLGRWLGATADRQPVLHHGDYHPGNVLVTEDRITGVLDWGNAYVTDADYAAAVGELRFVDLIPTGRRQTLRHAFRSGYREHSSLRAAFDETAAAYKLLWLLQNGRNIAGVITTRRGRHQVARQLRNWLARRVPTRSFFTGDTLL